MTRCASCGASIIIDEHAPGRHHLAVYDAETGKPHVCPHDPVPDWVECVCGVQIHRYTDGRRMNLDGTAHMCARKQAPAPKKTTTTARRGYVRAVNTEVHHG